MARDYYDESKPKKKKKETPKPQKVTKSPSVTKVNNVSKNSTFLGGGSSVKKVEQRQSAAPKKQTTTTKRTTMTDAQYQKTYGEPRKATAQRNQTTKPEPVTRTTNHRLTAAQTQKMYGTQNPNLKTAEEQRREREERRKEREERRLAAQRQKSGLNDQPTDAQKAAANRAIKNTPALVNKALKDTGSGYLQTLNDITERTASNPNATKAQAMKMGIEEGSKQYRQLEENRKKTVEKARQDNDSLYQKMQQRQEEWDKKAEGAKGFEKAYYGAVESGTGMLADTAIGLLTGTGQAGALASMGLRTYGSSANQAKAEGATDAEAGWYGLGQAVKEMGTEMIGGGGLAKMAYGKGALGLGDIAANTLIRNLKGQKADLAHMGVRLLGDVAEENIEELAGWGLDPLIKEITYGRNTRERNARGAMQDRSNALRAEIQNEDDARAAAAYLSSDDFFEQTVKAYREAGLSKKDAEEVADRMRDYLTASLTGDTDSMEQIEDEVSRRVAGSHNVLKDYSFRELKETFEATTLLVGATGLPGNISTMNRGNLVKEQLGAEGVNALASTAIDFEDSQMSTKAKAMKARIDSGKELTGTQVYELQAGMQEQVRKDTEREQSSRRMAARAIESDNLLTPYRENENGGIDLDEATQAAYREHANRAGQIIDAIADEKKESITDTQKIDGSKAIAGFQTGVFTVDDANALNYSNTAIRSAFETATGINLGQYVVTKRNGEVDIPATNTKTKDALFAMAADNLVKSAQAETANWMDNAKGQVVTQVSARMGAQGSAVLQQALDDVDERDRSKYMMTANATDMLYQAARNMGTEWSDIAPEATRMFPGISESKLKMMYEAGLADREMANDKARGRQVRMGEALSEMGEQETATGKVFIDTEVPLKGSVIRTFTEISRNLGADIHFVDYIYDDSNNPIEGANGSYDPNTNTFYLNVATGAETNIGYIFMHETTHYLKNFAPEQYQALENLVRERWFAYNPSQMQDAIARKIEAYKRATNGKQVLTEEQALEEIIADASHDFINDPEFAKQVAEEDMGLAKAILDSIRNALRMLRRIFASGSIEDDTHMNSLFRELDILSEAEKLWLDAYKVAVQNSAAAAVDNWQSKANQGSVAEPIEEKQSFSISEPVERVKDLIAVHNLKPEDIRNTFELGGFPMPSIAVTKDSMGHDMYGDISLLFGSDTIDPKFFRSNQVFGGDAYTPTFPATQYKPNEDIVEKLRDIYYDNAKTLGYDAMRPFYELAEDAENALNRNGGEQGLIDRYKNDVRAMRTFLKINGKDVEDVVKRTEDTISETEQKLRQHFIDTLGEDAIREFEGESIPHGKAMMDHRKNWTYEHSDEIKSAYRDFLNREFSFSDEEISNVLDNMNLFETMKLVRNALNYLNNGPTTVKEEVDRAATDKAIEDAAHELGYEEWIDGLLTGIEEKRGIRNDKEFFTRNGNRRSWDTLHDDITLENVVKAMRSELAAGGNGFLWKNPKGAAQKQYKSLDEIRADEDRLQQLPEEEYKSLEQAATQKLSDVLSDVVDNNPGRFMNSFGAVLDAGEYIAEILNETRDKDTMQRKLKKDYSLEVSDEQMDRIAEAIEEIANIPTGYFEAKPRRAVGFDEVKAAIIPQTMDADIKAGLESRGIPFYEYDPEVEGNRTEVVNRAATEKNLRFSISEDAHVMYTPKGVEVVQNPTDSEYNSMREEILAEYPWLRGTGEPLLRKTYDESGNEYYWNAFEAMHSQVEPYINKEYNTRTSQQWKWYEKLDKDDYPIDYSKQGYRFSITDSEGNSLSEGQAEFFADSKMVDAEGRLKPMYHGTQNEFYEFDITKAYPGTLGRGFYFSDSDSHAGVYGKTNKYYLNLVNPLMPSTNNITRDQLHRFVTELSEDEDYGLENYGYGATVDSVVDSIWGKSDFAMLRDLNLTAVGDFAEALKVFNRVNDTDYDGIITDTETLAFYPQQVKSVDNLNPTLSKDTRYSITDSRGRELTDGQVEYFKNSQARDAEGKMQVVYHTTNHGGFTIFDPSYSDDRRSLFFASNFNVSQTYGYNADRPINTYDMASITDVDSLRDYLVKNGSGYKGHSFVVVPNKEWQELLDIDADWSMIANHQSVYSYENILNNWKEYKATHESPTKTFAFDSYLKDVESGNINPEDYTILLKLPNKTSNKFFDDAIAVGNSIDELIRDIPKEMIDQYTGSATSQIQQHGYYKVYLNLENPLIVDANGANWSAITYGEGNNSIRDAASVSLSAVSIEWDFTEEGVPKGLSIYAAGEWKNDGEWEDWEEGYSLDTSAYNTDDPEELQMLLSDDLLDVWENDFRLDYQVLNDISDRFADLNGDVEANFDPRYFDETGDELDPSDYDDEAKYSTRDLAELAESQGRDGVIIRNCRDIGGSSFLKGGNPISDIFIAFSSEQVKDINNTEPTENPDIRYSFVDEDESLSRIAYEDAMSDSYDVLQEYETSVIYGSESEFFKGKAYAANMDEEAISAFYDALKAEDAVPSADLAFEEDRVRRARSKEDFYNNVYAKWSDRWTTEGEVLDITSVKKNIKHLVMGVMANSNTDAKYRNDIVKQTLLDVRTAYQLMKQDRSDVASYLLYHSAQRMIEGVEFIKDDTAFKEYKEIRNFLRGYRINVPEEYWQNVEFNDFRKEYYGRLRIGKGNNNIESVYQDLADRWPYLFNESEREKAGLGDAVEDLLQHIGVVVDSNVTPFMEAYSSEEAVSLVSETADALYDIMVGGKELVSLADSYKNRFDEKTKAMKQRHYEAILRERKIREEGIRKEREKFRVYRETRKEKALHTKYFEGIKNKYDELTKRLLTNTKEKHIPEQYKRELAELLKAFDFQTVGSKKREARTGYKAQNTIKLEAMRTALERIEANSQLFHINDSITDIMKDLLGLNETSMNKQSIEGKTLDELNASELKQIDKLLGFLIHEFNNYEKVKVGVKKAQAADVGHAQNDISLEHAEALGEGKDYQTPFLQSIDRIINLDMMTPAFLFRKIDPNNEGLGLMWKEIRKSFDKYVRNTNQLNEWIEEIVGEYHDKGILWNKYGSGELSKWRSINYAQTFKLTYGTLELTPAQMMSVACLANRKQAYDHMVGAGVVVSPVSFQAKIMSDVKKKINKSLSLKLTDEDIKTIVTALTPEQRQVANKLQELMATKMAAWGNEASVNVIGIKLFEDPDYFPIRSDKAGLTKDLDPNQFEQAIRNFGFAKAVQPGARNAIMIDDIFDVVTEHCNNMNLYNAYTESMNDFMKVYNYREVREEGEYTVEQALRHAYSDKAPMFIMQFMRDLNGNVSGRASGIESMYNALLANAKKASVFANFRVAAQQPTALSRAFYVIDEKYIKGIKVEKDAMVEMFEHCPIALWKSWGYYDINMGKSIEDVIMNNGRWLEDKATDLYGALDNVTWTAIWQMVKAETKDLYPELKEGTDEFFEHCNERMSEVVDLTQVVDSPMHRSHAMRDKGFFKKMTTAFMAEPTLTLNMLRDGVTRTREAYKRGKAKLASKILTRTIGVYLLQSVMVAAAQSIVDALRGKNPNGDDDDDDGLLHLWWVNFIENWKEELNPLGKIYVVKDIKSMMDGWENRNLALQGVYYLSLGYRQFTGDPYARSSKSWYENMLYGMGYLTGVPIKTMMTGVSNAKNMLGIRTPILDEYAEYLDSLAGEKEGSEASIFGGSIGELLKQSMDATANMMGYKPIEESTAVAGATVTDKTSKSTKEDGKDSADSVPTRESLPDNLTDEQKDEIIKSATKRAEKATPAEEQQQLDYDTMLYNALKAASGLEGEEYNKKVYSSVANGMKQYIADGDYTSIGMMRTVIEQAGGDVDYFDKRVLEETKTAYKKTLSYDQTLEERNNMKAMYRYMMKHGMTQEQLSEDILYSSDLAKDMKVAYRLGDDNLIYEAMTPLVDAGITRTDLDKLYTNRNKMDLNKYKEHGRYKDKLKSMGTFIWPTDGQITSYFGYRNAPTAGASSNHPAIDIGAPMGSEVVAADGGVVITAGWNGGYGNSVGIKHDNGMVTYYNHLSAWNVKEGDTVAQGQPIANVGSTGISTGPHLDFKILDAKGEPVDPLKYLSSRS